jgi:hypothetical protein
MNQIVGLSAAAPGSALIKRFQVPAGTVITGIEIKRNDDRVVFPKVTLYGGRAEKLSEATRLAEVGNVGASGRHRLRPSFGSIRVSESGPILVAVSWPVSSGVRGTGDGAGIGATAIEAPGDCFISPGMGERMQPLLADLAITLVTGDAGKGQVDEHDTTILRTTFQLARRRDWSHPVRIRLGALWQDTP